MIKYIKLSQWAKAHDYTYTGAWCLFHRGGIPAAKQLDSGAIVVSVEATTTIIPEHTIVYTRVSSSENKTNLDAQAERVCAFCAAKGWVVHEVIKECASGLNDARPKLIRLLKERKATRLVVEHKDRLTRFGFNYIVALYPECEIVIINEAGDAREDLMTDFISLVTSFCARLYGNRRSKRKTERLIEELKKE